jgi:phenylacetic acid degradation operon negative regulatory protein
MTRRAARPGSVILTFYGAFVRRLDGWVAVAHLIELMGEVGLDPQAVRSATSRLKRRGWLVPSRRGAAAGYELSDVARAALSAGDQRIYEAQQPADLAAGWALVVFSVPESERSRRHLLRSRLTWLGFGSDAPGVWIGPRRLMPAARGMLTDLGLERYVDLYEAAYTGFGDARQLVERCWDLGQLRRLYTAFLTQWEPVIAAAEETDPDERRAFTDYLAALDQWRGLPFLDPGLPSELLPSGWEGHAASALFHALMHRLEPPAFRHVQLTVRR